jgi:hypothetical protein
MQVSILELVQAQTAQASNLLRANLGRQMREVGGQL